MKEMYSLSLILLACILAYVYEWKQPAIMCCAAAGVYSLGIIRDGLGDLYYANLIEGEEECPTNNS